jgi:uncharacterized SAM-binding protein YcdF (DUF218 family)
VGGDRFYLVTSAVHMPRSVALFRNQGLDPIPAPGQYWYKPMPDSPLIRFFPSSSAVRASNASVHEYLGILWYWFRGRI